MLFRSIVGKLYNEFKQQYKIPLNHLHLVEQMVDMSAYLTPQEYQFYLRRWSAQSQPNFQHFTIQQYIAYHVISQENQLDQDVQTSKEHYLDEGCRCNSCNTQRESIHTKVVELAKTTPNQIPQLTKDDRVVHYDVETTDKDALNLNADTKEENVGSGGAGSGRDSITTDELYE